MAIIGIDPGIPNSEGSSDLYVRIQLQVPKHPSPQEKALYRQLRALTGSGR